MPSIAQVDAAVRDTLAFFPPTKAWSSACLAREVAIHSDMRISPAKAAQALRRAGYGCTRGMWERFYGVDIDAAHKKVIA